MVVTVAHVRLAGRWDQQAIALGCKSTSSRRPRPQAARCPLPPLPPPRTPSPSGVLAFAQAPCAGGISVSSLLSAGFNGITPATRL